MARYTASRIYHYPDGVVVPGDVAELTDDEAQRGLEDGVLFAVPSSTVPATDPISPEIEE